jgi:hypothetical protein
VIAYSSATSITAILAAFFVLMGVIALVRSIFRRESPPTERRFRVGVFVERDHVSDEDADDGG